MTAADVGAAVSSVGTGAAEAEAVAEGVAVAEPSPTGPHLDLRSLATVLKAAEEAPGTTRGGMLDEKNSLNFSASSVAEETISLWERQRQSAHNPTTPATGRYTSERGVGTAGMPVRSR